MNIDDVRLIYLPRITDPRGNLSFVQDMDQVPFNIRRVFWTYDVPAGESRGAHAHQRLNQLIVAVSGSFSVTVDDGVHKRTFMLNHPYAGLHVPPGVWSHLHDYSSGAVSLVMADDLFDEADYIRDYEQFLKYKAL